MRAAQMADQLTGWLCKQMETRGARGFVVGLSGGIDSAVTLALCKRACPQNTLGIIMPCYSDPQDALDARAVAEALSVPVEEVNLSEPFELMVKKLTGKPYKGQEKDLTVANIKPRLRMITLYFFAARHQYLVVGTGNCSELTIGYFTKYGDGGVDLLPLGNLVKFQVRELAVVLGVPRQIIKKTPSAGLWAGQYDEAEMGITYDELDELIFSGKGSDRVREVVETLAARNAHKKEIPVRPPFYKEERGNVWSFQVGEY